ncbi:LOW QUALITY PROTEIN: transesterase [Coccidioides immitis H538.4]|uniref:Transesterase n=1 Tax=Coccidioides immitis H538.4 TaxID=396776 RepID=A0A0J8ULZ2_COCIT|nr:LOW QUALITY PROTEIN: transesterase [Coccidioides immitis H538.4]
MVSLEQAFEEACNTGKIPHAVLASSNKDESFTYLRAFGFKTLSEEPKQAIKNDDIMMIFSLTKRMTSIAALQCVERSLIQLDDDVAQILPDLAALEILEGYNSDTREWILRKRKNAINLRSVEVLKYLDNKTISSNNLHVLYSHLLTHSSGLIYEGLSPLHRQYNKAMGRPKALDGPTITTRYTSPLLFEPGTSWGYGTGLDWAGLLVTCLTKMNLEEYMKEHIWSPLGIHDATFWPEKNLDLSKRIAEMALRDPPAVADAKGKIIPYAGPSMRGTYTEEMGGQGVFTSISSELKGLKSNLVDGGEAGEGENVTNDVHASALVSKAEQVFNNEASRMDIAEYIETAPYDWGLGGMLTLDNVGWARRKGTMTWSGLPNLFWFIDREADLCGVYGGQVLMNGDPQTF